MRFASEGNAHAPLNSLHSRSLPVLAALSLLSALSAATLTGCGIGKIETSSPETASLIPAFSGSLRGGQSPIVNATVKVYTTGVATNCGASATGACSATDSGYGQGTFLQEATQQGSTTGQDTDASGTFSFPGGYRCPVGEFAYLVGSGGQPVNSTNPTNSKILLVAALGRCEDLYGAVTGDGSGYTSAPTVSFTNASGDTTGSGAAATATVVSGNVTSVTVNNGGTGYTLVPTVTLSGGGGSGAYAVASMGVGAVAVVNGGSNYTSSPVVSFSGGGGTGAAATAFMGVNAVSVVSGGSGYTQPPNVTFSGGGGSGATATAFLGSPGAGATQVVGYTVTNPGSGYTSAPTVIITNASGDTTGSGASAASTLQVLNYSVTTPGSGYTSAPTVILTNAGGDTTGSGATATSSLQVAAVNIPTGAGYSNYSGTPITVNELTTVAAAYALGNFSTVTNSGTPSTTQVLIGAPSTLNAAKVSNISTGCVAGVGTCTTTAAAGLYHAFLNAANIANPYLSSTETSALSSLTNNANAVVPRELINTIASGIANCVDSAGTGAQCTGLPGGGANTFSAVVALAANPTFSGATNVSSGASYAFWTASKTTPQFSPVLTAAPNDWSIAINYTSGLSYPYTGALDINDVFYTVNAGTSAVAPVDVLSFSSNGTLLGTSATDSNFKTPYGLAMDALGNGTFGNGSNGGSPGLGYFTTSGGVPSTIKDVNIITSTLGNSTSSGGLFKIYGTAFDMANNLWLDGATASGSFSYTIVQCPKASAPTAGTTDYTLTCVGAANPTESGSSSGAMIGVDPNQNIWTAQSANLAVLENTGSVASPTYASTAVSPASAPVTNPILGIGFYGSPFVPYITGYKSTSAFDSGVVPMSYTLSATPATGGVGIASVTSGSVEFNITSGSSSTATGMSGAYGSAIDGAGTDWVADYNGHDFFQTTPTSGSPTSYRLLPCLGGSTTCPTIFTSTGKPTSISIDSTGSLWITSPPSASVVQVIGSAFPTWPLLSLGKIGKP